MKLKSLILVGFLFSIVALNAQTEFRPGYIISLTGDTIYGEIDYRGDFLMSRLCKFKSKNDTIIDYSPDDIAAYRFIDSKYYVPREIEGKNVFLEYLIKGKANIYYMRDINGDHYYIDKEDMDLMEIPYDESIIYTDDKAKVLKSTKHIGVLNYFMQDAPKFQSQIKSLNKPDRRNLIKLAKSYHNIVCEDEQCVIYERTAKSKYESIKITPEIVMGVSKYSNVRDFYSGYDIKYAPYSVFIVNVAPSVSPYGHKVIIDMYHYNNYQIHTGLITHISLPKYSEKFHLRTGFLFSQLKFKIYNSKDSYQDRTVNYFKIPLQIEYIYHKGLVRPRIAYGPNVYLSKQMTVSCDVGANIKLSNSFYISATSDFEFIPTVVLFPRKLFSYSLKLGVLYNI